MKLINKIRNKFKKDMSIPSSEIGITHLNRLGGIGVYIITFPIIAFFIFPLWMGLINYPQEISSIEIFETAGKALGDVSIEIWTMFYESGVKIGNKLYPLNVFVGKFISFSFKLFLLWLFFRMVYLGFTFLGSNMYRINRLLNEAKDEISTKRRT